MTGHSQHYTLQNPERCARYRAGALAHLSAIIAGQHDPLAVACLPRDLANVTVPNNDCANLRTGHRRPTFAPVSGEVVLRTTSVTRAHVPATPAAWTWTSSIPAGIRHAPCLAVATAIPARGPCTVVAVVGLIALLSCLTRAAPRPFILLPERSICWLRPSRVRTGTSFCLRHPRKENKYGRKQSRNRYFHHSTRLIVTKELRATIKMWRKRVSQ